MEREQLGWPAAAAEQPNLTTVQLGHSQSRLSPIPTRQAATAVGRLTHTAEMTGIGHRPRHERASTENYTHR